MTGSASRVCLSPCHVTAVNALVSNLKGVHRGVAVVAVLLGSGVILPLIGPVAVSALV